MFQRICFVLLGVALAVPESVSAQPLNDPRQHLERTCFQTGASFSEIADLRSDVAIVYGIDPGLPARMQTWRDHGYRVHVMTGVSWGHYQDYLYGKFDGVNHEDEAQTDRNGKKISHGGDVYYMCPGETYGRFLSVGVQRALDAGAEAIHLEEPEFWVRAGYSDGFKREWKKQYGEDWAPPHSSPDAQWRTSKLKYFLYRRALQQVFDHVQDYNRRTGRKVRCYVPTHSLLNYAQWRIVSPESSLARLDGCDGYIAQVWTGTARTPNFYRGERRERTFETAFLEYGAMQNLVSSTGRSVWYLNDPVEDNPDHDWDDYRRNWESTLVASLFQPDVWQYEVAPWPERVFGGRYPKKGARDQREPMPPAYATEVQTVINALNDMNQKPVEWDCGTARTGVLISDSLMFERGDPVPGDPDLSAFYGLALPLLKRGIPVTPVQLENVTLKGSLDRFDLLLMTYHGMKPLTPEVHAPLAKWVRSGGVLVFWDDDSDPYNSVREWWNSEGRRFSVPRQHLFQELGLAAGTEPGLHRVGKGALLYRAANPVSLAREKDGDVTLVTALRDATRGSRTQWVEANCLVLRRGKYVIAAGIEESISGEPKRLVGHFVNLFDPALRAVDEVILAPGNRYFLLDLDQAQSREPAVLVSACKAVAQPFAAGSLLCQIEGVAGTRAVILLRSPLPPRLVALDGQPLTSFQHDAGRGLLWVDLTNEARCRTLGVSY